MINTDTITGKLTAFTIIVEDVNDNSFSTLDFLSVYKTEEESMEAARNAVRIWINQSTEKHEKPTWGTAAMNVPNAIWAENGLFVNPVNGFPIQHYFWDEDVFTDN